MPAASDDTLLASFALGDPDAAAAFIRRYQGRVYGLARLMVSDPDLAEEVAQEAFIRAWRHARAYDPRRGSVHTWMMVITRSVAIDSMRLRPTQPLDPHVLSSLDLRGPVGAGPPKRQRDQRRDGRATGGAGRPARRAAPGASAGRLCGRTASEISELEGIPLGTAKTRIRTPCTRSGHDGQAEDRSSEVCRAGGGGRRAGLRHGLGRRARPCPGPPGRLRRLPPARRPTGPGGRPSFAAGPGDRTTAGLRVQGVVHDGRRGRARPEQTVVAAAWWLRWLRWLRWRPCR